MSDLVLTLIQRLYPIHGQPCLIDIVVHCVEMHHLLIRHVGQMGETYVFLQLEHAEVFHHVGEFFIGEVVFLLLLVGEEDLLQLVSLTHSGDVV